MKLIQSTQLLTQLDSRYLVSHLNNIVYPPELCQPVQELQAIIAALPASVEVKFRTLHIINTTVIEYITVSRTAENLLKAIESAGAAKEPLASEQLQEQQVSGFSSQQ